MPARWRETQPAVDQLVIQRRIERCGANQLGLITHRQLLWAGLSAQAISKRARSERLHPTCRRGVYSLHPPPLSAAQSLNAAVLSLGPDAVASDFSAAFHTGLADDPPRCHHLTVPPAGGRAARRGIAVHRRLIDPRDRFSFAGVLCTTPHRTLVDLAPTESEQTLEMIMVAAASEGLLNRSRLIELVEERRGRPGTPKLERLLELEPEITRSGLERIFRPIWELADLPRPQINRFVEVPGREKPLEVDLTWPEIRLAVELDSQRFHGDWEAAERDRERDQLLALAGWTCHRFVRRRVAEDRAGTADRLRRLYGLRLSATAAAARR